MRIVSAADTRYIVDAYHEVFAGIRPLRHAGLATDRWYGMGALDAYKRHRYDAITIPRRSGTERWWKATDPHRDLIDSLDVIGAHVRSAIHHVDAQVFVTADDTGPLEVFLIDQFRRAGIPVVLVQHGPNAPSARPPTFARLKHRARRSPLPYVGPAGTNGATVVCSYSGIGASALRRNGVRRIEPTGFPYFDLIHRNLGPPAGSDSVLIVSSGAPIFGRADTNVAAIVKDAVADGRDVVLRLKPGEEPTLAVRQLVDEFGVQLDDNAVPSYEAVRRHGLVVGAPSTVLLEAILQGVPAALTNQGAGRPDNIFSLRDALEYLLGVAVIDRLDPTTCSRLTGSTYIDGLRERLDQHEDAFFHRFDGRAAERVHDVLSAVTA